MYRLAGREREKSASYYTPESLTKCLVKYALKELLQDKTTDEILQLTVCEPAMGSAAFLNETINQLAEAYLAKKQEETKEFIKAEDRLQELQKVKMYIADRNVYGIDLNPIAVELAEVSLWLNTIYAGGYVPWFGTQLVNGNSLIGARRQCYSVEHLQTSTRGMRWYELAPERVALNGAARKKKKQIYHFLLGDPGMSKYDDKVIKELEPDNIKLIKEWNKKFIKPYNDEEIESLTRLSGSIDRLWDEQIENRKKLEAETRDSLSIYGYRDDKEGSHTSIREKDKILHETYKSEKQRNAGAYARLKFAMDYWCSLWFWPIEKAELLPDRATFLFELDLILNGTVSTDKKDRLLQQGQTNLFSIEQLCEAGQLTESEQMKLDFTTAFCQETVVDIPMLCQTNERLALVQQIAEQNHFMHWELEFADLFKERGGFDLIVGNPPWVKLEWNEKDVISDIKPIINIRSLNALQASSLRNGLLLNEELKKDYLNSFEQISGEQSFFNAVQNYYILQGVQPNLYKCFIPQAEYYCGKDGVFSFIHPEGVYNDVNGGMFRRNLYKKLRKHFQFQNEHKLFEIGNRERFSINVYSNKETFGFQTIANLVEAITIDDCYQGESSDCVPGIKDENNNWSVVGHKQRIVNIGADELKTFANLFDGTDDFETARLPAIHAKSLVEVLVTFTKSVKKLEDYKDRLFITRLWGESAAQANAIINVNTHFPDEIEEFIYSGPHVGVANPIFQTAKRICDTHRAYEIIDLTEISEKFFPRTKYSVAISYEKYLELLPSTSWGKKYTDEYRVVSRKRLNLSGERTLISCIAPPKTAHIDTVIGIACADKIIGVLSGLMASIPCDFYIKIIGGKDINASVIYTLPYIDNRFAEAISFRSLLLNAVNSYYDSLWKSLWNEEWTQERWSKCDNRLENKKIGSVTYDWNYDTPLRTDYERRQALVEIDVLTSMALGMTLEQLKTIYRIQFPVLQSYEADTWYDVNGRIVFSKRSLGGLTVDRSMWERQNAITPIKRGTAPWDGIMKNAPEGYVFARTITDDTMPGGPVERTIEYVAPFDRCDREKDYETAWKFFEEKYSQAKEEKQE